MTTVRFLQDSRHEDWKKGDKADVVRIIALPPANQFTIYILQLENGSQVWATNKDVETWNQLSLF